MEKTLGYNEITHGVIWKELLKFFFPILLGSLFQQLYNTVDAIVVGQILGKEALAAVGGGTSTAINLLIGFFVGLSSGATVIVSHYYGAEDEESISNSIHNASAIALWGGIIISIAGYLTTQPLLQAIGTTPEVLPLAVKYMKIYFAGAFIVVMYNIGAAIFRAIGDSKRPLYFLIAGCFVNIILDILFVGKLGMGVEGAAYATVASQLISLVLVIIMLARKEDCCRLVFSKIRFHKDLLKKTFKIGLPSGFQSILFSISNLMIYASINRFGTDAAAAWAAYGKIDCLFWMALNAFAISIVTFVGQNYGAGLYDRAKKGVRQCLIIVFVTSFIIEALYMIFGKACYRLFTNDQHVIEIGMDMLYAIVPYFFTYILAEILSGAIRGTGNTLVPTITTVFCICILRAVWLRVAPLKWDTLKAVLACYPITWVVTSLALTLYYLKGKIFPKQETTQVK